MYHKERKRRGKLCSNSLQKPHIGTQQTVTCQSCWNDHCRGGLWVPNWLHGVWTKQQMQLNYSYNYFKIKYITLSVFLRKRFSHNTVRNWRVESVYRFIQPRSKLHAKKQRSPAAERLNSIPLKWVQRHHWCWIKAPEFGRKRSDSRTDVPDQSFSLWNGRRELWVEDM